MTRVTTKAQRQALKRVFDRQALTPSNARGTPVAARRESIDEPKMSYRQFRRLAVFSFGVLMVPWCGMWLGIETDGYTHS